LPVRAVPHDLAGGEDLSRTQCDLRLDHQGYGCVSVTGTLNGRRHPFVFARCRRRTKIGWLPYARLVSCRGLDELARFAGPLGRFLALRGVPGRFLDENPRYFKGAPAPRPGDLAYTELSLFGI